MPLPFPNPPQGWLSCALTEYAIWPSCCSELRFIDLRTLHLCCDAQRGLLSCGIEVSFVCHLSVVDVGTGQHRLANQTAFTPCSFWLLLLVTVAQHSTSTYQLCAGVIGTGKQRLAGQQPSPAALHQEL